MRRHLVGGRLTVFEVAPMVHGMFGYVSAAYWFESRSMELLQQVLPFSPRGDETRESLIGARVCAWHSGIFHGNELCSSSVSFPSDS